MTTLTDADVAELWRYMKAWQSLLGLDDWNVGLSKTRCKKKGVLAEMVAWDWPQRQVTCRVGTDWKSTDIDSKTLEQTAVHELLHVLLHELIEAAKNHQTVSDDDLKSAEHRVINTLERILVPGGE